MTDLDIIKQIEKDLNVKLCKVNKLNYNSKSYSLDKNGHVIELSIDDYVIEKIIFEISQLKSLTTLDLSNNEISDIYPLTELKSLTTLYLNNNQIKDISPLKELKKLTSLYLSKNQIRNISALEELKSLTTLSLYGNQISEISALNELKNLTTLYLNNNQIRNIAPLKELISLTKLYLYNNQISDISPLVELVNITILYLSGNQIIEIAPLKELKSLTKLYLYNNQIIDISPLKELMNLTTLYLHDNQIIDISPLEALLSINDYLFIRNNPIDELPAWVFINILEIQWMDSILENYLITFYNNPLNTPPIEIVKQGKEAIRNYFKQLEKEKGKTEYLFEAKLLVLGEGGTGKTTFTRKIQDVNAKMPLDKDTTLGIDVGKWNYEIDFPKLQNLGKVKFNVNLWDFGGQEIYRGTHQIFFTDKSFYVLIDDTREQKTDFSYWLNTVEQLGGEDSSLIIVLNKRYNRKHTFDESGFRKHFGKLIREVIELDMKEDKTGIFELQDKIKMYLKQLPGIGNALPPSWVSIREDLLKEEKNYISFDHFREICAAHDINDNSMIHTLSGYYNRIGAFTHYINDPVLQERIYLNSNWLVKTVYEVLDNETAKVKKGRLTGTDIKQIWGNNELLYEVNKLTQLMHKFGLMYHIPCSENYVVPAHLPTITPYKTWAHEHSPGILQFIYEFDKYMPQGIMSRLIVALHHHIKNHEHVWHRGVNIEANGAQAEIKESYGGSNRFEIRIAGTNKIELLAIIRERFAEVLQPYKNLNYKQLVPCICDECKNSMEPAFHEYNLLLKYREKGTGSQCTKTGAIISAEELLKITEVKAKTKKRESDSISEKEREGYEEQFGLLIEKKNAFEKAKILAYDTDKKFSDEQELKEIYKQIEELKQKLF